MYEKIAHIASQTPNRVDWSKVHFFWTDERDVPPDDSQNNFNMARTYLLQHLPVPADNLHRFRTELPAPQQVVQEYERELRSYFVDQGRPRFDLVLLGLGRDGHTASLFERAEPTSHSLAQGESWVAAVRAAGLQNPLRFTLTPRALNAASTIAFVVSGSEKAEILKEIIQPGRAVAPRA